MSTKRERLEITLAGGKPDRPPVALWRHFPGDDQRPADLAEAILHFQHDWDFDFIRVMPANDYSVVDYGVQGEWDGASDGTRRLTRRAVMRSLDWTELRRHDPAQGSLGRSLETLRLLHDRLGEDIPYLQTIYSPLAQAEILSGRDLLIQNLRTHPDRVKTGLSIITDNTLRYMDTLRRTGIAGIFYEVGFASYEVISAPEYAEFGLPYDQKILNSLSVSWWFNVLRLAGQYPMLEYANKYPVQVVCWNDREGHIELARGKSFFEGTVCGGVGHQQGLHTGLPGEVRSQARDALEQTYGRRLILGSASPIFITTPRANIRSLRQFVEESHL